MVCDKASGKNRQSLWKIVAAKQRKSASVTSVLISAPFFSFAYVTIACLPYELLLKRVPNPMFPTINILIRSLYF